MWLKPKNVATATLIVITSESTGGCHNEIKKISITLRNVNTNDFWCKFSSIFPAFLSAISNCLRLPCVFLQLSKWTSEQKHVIVPLGASQGNFLGVLWTSAPTLCPYRRPRAPGRAAVWELTFGCAWAPGMRPWWIWLGQRLLSQKVYISQRILL